MVSVEPSQRRERSRNMVLLSLKKEPKRFTDLKNDENVDLSDVGLTSILKILLDENEIEIELIDNKKKYVLTNKGIISASDVNFLSSALDDIKSRGGKHYSTYSQNYPIMLSSYLSWGIDSHLTIDSEIDDPNLLSRSDVGEIEELLFKKISKNISKNKLDKKLVGNMVLGFTLNYSDLIKSIESKSLLYMKNISKEENKLLGKYEDDPESLTEKEFKRMNDLRIKTRKKIKKLHL